MPVPKLRPLDLVAGEWNGQQVVYARDHEGLLGSPVLLPLPVFMVALLLDGRRHVTDVQAEFARLSGGEILFSADLDRIIGDLDAHHLLETPALDARRRELEEAYRAAPYRPMAHAGLSYPADAEALTAALRGFMDDPGSPSAASHPDGSPARGILAPHIDFRRGGAAYGRAYRMLETIPDGACVMICGVAHAGPPVPYVLTTKGYATPWGVIEVDRHLLDAVVSRYPFDAFAYEAVHRTEHSIEFQALWLAYLAAGRPLTILPVLCSNLEGLCGQGLPSGVPQVEAFIAAVRGAITAVDRPVYIVGGVDLSHVGPRFGDDEPVGPGLAATARAGDLAALEHVVSGDPDGFWQAVMADGNRRRVCGLSAIYTVLRILAPVRGRVLDYRQGEDPAGGVVGFAAAVLGEGGRCHG